MQTNYSKAKFLCASSLIGIVIATWCCQLKAKPDDDKYHLNVTAEITKTKKIDQQIKTINAKGLNPKVLKLALTAYNNAKEAGYTANNILSVVDYSIASTQPRMWVIDLMRKKVLFHTHVAHGIGSGDNYAHRFSNRPGSHMSSLGLFLTGDTYNGHFGKSLVLHGIDGKFNSNAFTRRIVVHAAHYVDEHVVRHIGRLGRSMGCLALNKRVAHSVMQTIKGGSLIFCYYPEQAWLRESPMLRI